MVKIWHDVFFSIHCTISRSYMVSWEHDLIAWRLFAENDSLRAIKIYQKW